MMGAVVPALPGRRYLSVGVSLCNASGGGAFLRGAGMNVVRNVGIGDDPGVRLVESVTVTPEARSRSSCARAIRSNSGNGSVEPSLEFGESCGVCGVADIVRLDVVAAERQPDQAGLVDRVLHALSGQAQSRRRDMTSNRCYDCPASDIRAPRGHRGPKGAQKAEWASPL